jgi:hypothetical protein
MEYLGKRITTKLEPLGSYRDGMQLHTHVLPNHPSDRQSVYSGDDIVIVQCEGIWIVHNCITGKKLWESKHKITYSGVGLFSYTTDKKIYFKTYEGKEFDVPASMALKDRKGDLIHFTDNTNNIIYNIATGKQTYLSDISGSFANNFINIDHANYASGGPCFIYCTITGERIFEYRKSQEIAWKHNMLFVGQGAIGKTYFLSRAPVEVVECCVCLSELKAKTHAFIPCGHTTICPDCVGKFIGEKKPFVCPICQKNADIVKLY